MRKINKDTAMGLIQQSLDDIPELKQKPRFSPQFEKWQRDARVRLSNIFGGSSDHSKEFDQIYYSPFVALSDDPDSVYDRSFIEGLGSASVMLQSMIDEIRDFWEEEVPASDTSHETERPQSINTSQIFIIHGRDHGTRDTVTRFIETFGIEAIVLEEQPDQGLTIIEKFEQYSQCDFAIALFTPDDVGGLSSESLRPRIRQNVTFEFGYFIGKYGRDRVRALVKSSPEIPSDYSGVIYISLDDGNWKLLLIRELKSAGFTIDANLAFE